MCPICKGKLIFYTSKIDKCETCGLGVTKVIPTPDYNSYHRDNEYFQNSPQFANIFSKRAQLLTSYKKPGQVLEIGSSTGLLLNQLKSLGWYVQGIDPSAPAAKIAISHGIPTQISTFEKSTLKKAHYDAIILNHVLEHVTDPKKFITKVYSRLRPEGIVLIDVPNFASMSSILLKSHWPYLLTSEHLWHFTSKSLSLLLTNQSFTVIHQESRSGIWDYGYPFHHLFYSLTHFRKSFILDFASALPAYIMTKLNLGTSLTVIAQKSS